MTRETDRATSVDAFLGGLVTLVQPRGGHRVGLDAALLQAVVPPGAAGTAVDLGSGVGTVAFSVAARASGLSAAGVEREAVLVACGEIALERPENAGFAARVRLLRADVADRSALALAGLAGRSADFVLMNPPYDAPGASSPSPDEARRDAHVAPPETLSAWIRTGAGLLKPRGVLGLIHRAAALPAILQALAGRFGDVRALPVHPGADSPAGRIVVRAVSGSRAGFRLMPGLVLHRPGGDWTVEADAILRGRAVLPFD